MNITITQYIERDRYLCFELIIFATDGKRQYWSITGPILTQVVEEYVKVHAVDNLPSFLSESLYQKVVDVLVDGIIDETPVQTVYLGDHDLCF